MQKFVFENEIFRLELGEDAIPVSLKLVKSEEELLVQSFKLPLFTVTKERPYNNEIKLAFMNKKTEYDATRVEKEGDTLYVSFGKLPFKAKIFVDVKPLYISFRLEGFDVQKDAYPVPMDFPPVLSLKLLRIATRSSYPFGAWLNVAHTPSAELCLMASCPEVIADAQVLGDFRIMNTEVHRDSGLCGKAAILALGERDGFLDIVDRVERDYGLPLGVESRRSEFINSSIYWVHDLNPNTVDEHIRYAKMGGFRLMLVFYMSIFREEDGYSFNGNYEYRDSYPEGEKSLREMLCKIRDAGIIPGLHFLHTHIGIRSKYVTPVPDPRLNVKKQFTLARDAGSEDTELFVYESTLGAPMADGCRLVRLGSEIVEYESYSSEPPYKLLGCKRGALSTVPSTHMRGERGGVLDVSEFGGSSIYIDQNSDLQDEIAEIIKRVYSQGFGFVYMDGSEGVNPPFEYHVPAAQYRVFKHLDPAPLFGEGAAKAHFTWHMLSGANAFDIFPTEIFKQMIIEHPFHEAQMMKDDYTRVNFGWWAFRRDTRVDVYEFGTSKAAAYDCPATVMADLALFSENPRTEDILSMMSLWEKKRRLGLSEGEYEMLRQEDREHTLFLNEQGVPEIAECSFVDMENGVSAFVFTLRGKSCAVAWDNEGSCKFCLPCGTVSSLYDRPFGRELPFEKGEEDSFELSRRVYFTSTLDIPSLCGALKRAKVKR